MSELNGKNFSGIYIMYLQLWLWLDMHLVMDYFAGYVGQNIAILHSKYKSLEVHNIQV